MSARVRWVRAGAALAVAVSLALPVARLLWHAGGETALMVQENPAPSPVADTAPPDPAAIAGLASFDATPTPQALGPDMVLRGGVTPSDPSRAVAFVTVAGLTQRYATGDALSEGIVLTAIFSDRVTLDADGAVRKLAFPDAPVTSDTEGDPASAPDAAP